MSLSRIGGALVAAPPPCCAVTLVVGLNGGLDQRRGDGLGSLTLTVALVLLGAGPRSRDRRAAAFRRALARTGFLIGPAVELPSASASATADSALVVRPPPRRPRVVVGFVISGIGLLGTPGRRGGSALMFIAGVGLALDPRGRRQRPWCRLLDRHRGSGRR